MLRKLLNIDLVILVSALLLNFMGLFTLYSISTTPIRWDFLVKEFTNQLLYTIIGIFALLVALYIPYGYFRLKIVVYGIYIISLFLLLYTTMFGLEIKGVKRWIGAGYTILEDGTVQGGFTLQTSEFAKITMILVNSIILGSLPTKNEEYIGIGRKKNLISRIIDYVVAKKYYLLSMVLTTIVLINIFLQKSLSVTIVCVLIYINMLFFGVVRNKVRFLTVTVLLMVPGFLSQEIFLIEFTIKALALLVLSVAFFVSQKFKLVSVKTSFLLMFFSFIGGHFLGTFFWNNVLEDYQRDRIMNFLSFSEGSDLQRGGYQQYTSMVSVGAGQIFGQGLTQVQNDRVLLLPEPTTDFIFAIFSYKFGFFGVSILILVYSALIMRLIYLSDKIANKQHSLICIGVGSMIFIQLLINIGMNVGLLPIGGTTLPLISAGGSSLVATMIGIGLCLNALATSRLEKLDQNFGDNVVIYGWNK